MQNRIIGIISNCGKIIAILVFKEISSYPFKNKITSKLFTSIWYMYNHLIVCKQMTDVESKCWNYLFSNKWLIVTRIIRVRNTWNYLTVYKNEVRLVLKCNLQNALTNHMYVVPSISFQTFFVQAFKIVEDSWRFSLLLLYILCDDWPIFMISGSNEQLLQQLEYTLLKPECYSWWISKMQSRREDTLEERYAIKLCFKLGKNATETKYGMPQTAFRPSCMSRASVFEWHKRFKEGTESVKADERCGRSKEVRTPELIGQRIRVWVTVLRF